MDVIRFFLLRRFWNQTCTERGGRSSSLAIASRASRDGSSLRANSSRSRASCSAENWLRLVGPSSNTATSSAGLDGWGG